MLENAGRAGVQITEEMVEAGVEVLIRVPLLHTDHCQTDYDVIVTAILTAAFRCRGESPASHAQGPRQH